jgi:hypothetical protein
VKTIGIYLIAALVAASAFLGYGAWNYRTGLADGKAIERSAALAHAMNVIKERGETDAEIDSLPDADLCNAIGGVWVLPDLRCE